MDVVKINNQEYAVHIHQREEDLPCILMLHGFMGDHRAFDHLNNKLCTWCNPVTIDLLGHGKSSKPKQPKRYHEDEQIHDICKLIKMLNIRPIILFGYSMGGRLALKTVVDAPEIVDGLILESANCGISDRNERKKRKQLDAKWAAEIEADFKEFLAEWQELDLFQSPLPVDKPLKQQYQKLQSEQSPHALAASLRGFGTGSMSAICNNLHKLDLPVLLLAGSTDKKYQKINQYLVDQLPNATFLSIKAGHRTHLDNPSTFARSIKNYIDTIDF